MDTNKTIYMCGRATETRQITLYEFVGHEKWEYQNQY